MLKMFIIGNLGQDARLQEGNFNPFVTFSVAHTDKFADKSSIQHERTTWVNCILNRNFQNILPYLKRGTKVFCIGNISLRTYVDRENKTCAGIDCIVTDIELCGGSRPDTDTPQQKPQQAQESAATKQGKDQKKHPKTQPQNPFDYGND